jgi:large subunit ribosomal protein L3
MSIGVIGRKVGMTQVFLPDGSMVPVSVVAVEPNRITGVRPPERDGYAAVQLGTEERKRLTKPRLGQLKDLPKLGTLREFRVEDVSEYAIGQVLDVALFEPGELVHVTGVTKGKGFAGTVKRHGYGRGPETHGSDSHRQPGSIGQGTTPGRVWKGTKMAGPMGGPRRTALKMEIVKSDPERNVLLIRGSLPGAANGLVLVRKA